MGSPCTFAARADEPALAGGSGQHHLWRISFAIVAAGGVLALALVRGPAPAGLGVAAYVAAVVLYLLIALVAVIPGMIADLGVLARPLRVEAVLQTILVFLGVNVAWLLLLDEAQPRSALEDLPQPRGR
jgi:hypothetical protein